jgi:hypothetical protein
MGRASGAADKETKKENADTHNKTAMPPSMAPLLGRPTTTGPATASRLNRRTAGTVVEGCVCFLFLMAASTRKP